MLHSFRWPYWRTQFIAVLSCYLEAATASPSCIAPRCGVCAIAFVYTAGTLLGGVSGFVPKRILGSGSRHFFVAGYALDARLMNFWKGLNSQHSYSPFVCLLTSIWLKLRNVLTYSMIRARLVAAR
jgi:hypothetical protein